MQALAAPPAIRFAMPAPNHHMVVVGIVLGIVQAHADLATQHACSALVSGRKLVGNFLNFLRGFDTFVGNLGTLLSGLNSGQSRTRGGRKRVGQRPVDLARGFLVPAVHALADTLPASLAARFHPGTIKFCVAGLIFADVRLIIAFEPAATQSGAQVIPHVIGRIWDRIRANIINKLVGSVNIIA